MLVLCRTVFLRFTPAFFTTGTRYTFLFDVFLQRPSDPTANASALSIRFLIALFLVSPTESYRFSERLEGHAVDTYEQFLHENEKRLRKLPVPDVAHDYFDNFLYYFEEFQLSREENLGAPRRPRPKLESLYDVFENIVKDEKEHSKTMDACSDYIENGAAFWYNGKSVTGTARLPRVIPSEKRAKFWRRWEQLMDGKNKNNSKSSRS